MEVIWQDDKMHLNRIVAVLAFLIFSKTLKKNLHTLSGIKMAFYRNIPLNH
jgi:hypothetical protein